MRVSARSLFWVFNAFFLASSEVGANGVIGSLSSNVVYERMICQGGTRTVSCGEGKVIYLEQGFYGRTNRQICVLSGSPQPRHCHPESISYQIIWESCEGMNSCTLTATDDAMQSNQCLKVDRFLKYIYMQYRCDKPGRKTIGQCTGGEWGVWLNTDNPGGIGDIEMVSNHRNLKGGCGSPLATEIRLSDDRDYHEGNNVLRIGQTYGVECRKSRQKSGVACKDYKVRYCCFKRKPVVRCPYPGKISNGIGRPLRSSFRVNQHVTYVCQRNYKVTKPNRLLCKPDGTWSASLPSCVPAMQINRCKAFGDPHFMQYDGSTRYDFMGKCTYLMSEACKIDRSDERWFSVESVNEERNNFTKVSYVGSVRVKLLGGSITIVIGKEGKITVNGRTVNEVRHDFYSVTPSGMQTVLKTKYGLRVAYNGNGLTIELNEAYKDEVCGICGNFNGDDSDDLTMASGEVAKDFIEFANSYETESCEDILPKEPVVCTPEEQRKWEERCSDLNSKKSVFNQCHGAVNPKQYFDSCVFDSCATAGSQSDLDQALTEYAQDCKRFGIRICDWRARTKASKVSCPRHSSYRGCTSPCTNTCQNPSATLTCTEKPTVEACVCNRGFLREGGKCVRRSQCGCNTKEGLSVPQGTIIEETEGSECECVRQNQFECRCKPGYTGDGINCKAMCQSPKVYNECGSMCGGTCASKYEFNQGCPAVCIRGCFCPPGMLLDEESDTCVKPSSCPERGLCRAYGDPHYSMYEKSSVYDFMGKCTYVMSRTYGLEQTDPRWFSVHAENEERNGHTRVSYLRNIKIMLDGGATEILLEQGGVAKINGEIVQEATTPTYKLRMEGLFLVVTTCFGVEIKFNGNGFVIKVPTSYRDQVKGLCGDYNGDESDDLMMADGTMAKDFDEFGASFQVGDCEDPDIPDKIICTDEDKKKWYIHIHQFHR